MTGLAAAAAFLAFASGDPRFIDFPALVTNPVRRAEPRLVTPFQRKFRTVIRDAATKPVNFAGHFVVAEWGCGTGCEQIAIVDEQSGAVYNGPFGARPESTVYFGPNVDDDKTGLFFHPDSSLFIVRGCMDARANACGTYYYRWLDTAFRLLKKAPAPSLAGSQ
jgi:hypothetical protein